ncbi:PREDICTED: centromere protein I-like [Branchiostoma belcheri]|uniref:Centromere protein I-like n=1 Tax=Branchiostoma belcheri TaxID=7741 RepID=A0A6P4ZZ91_BRABE|nr:PREDICTED: centromere protein I-like [Branchiostoma belcheri]
MAEEATRQLPNLEDSLSYFTDESASTKVRGNIKLQLALEGIEQHAQNKGLSPDTILSLTQVITSGKFADSTNSRLVKCLIPATTVPEEAAVRAISWMCTNKPSKNVQALLLRWLVLVYDLIDGKDKLHALYGVLFFFIQSDVLCPHVCHLLYLLTRKQDVRLFRVRPLLDMQTRVGAQPHVTGLLSLYKLYRPELINVPLKTHRVFFKQTDKAWAALIRQVQLRNCPREERDQWLKTTQIPITNLINDVDPTTEPRAKKAKLDCIPAIEYSGCLDQNTTAQSDKVPVQLVGSFQELLNNLDNLELPSQAAAVLRSQYLQHLVSCHPQQHVAHRIGYWLYRTLHQDLVDCPSASTKPRVEKLLKALINFTDFLQEGVPLCEMFLWEYLFTWNGLDHRPQILQLITRSRLHPFQRLNDYVLEPLRRLFFTSRVHCKCQILACLTELLRNHVSVEWARHQQTQNSEEETTSLSLFPVDSEVFPALQSIQELVFYVDRLCVVGLQQEDGHAMLMHYTLGFFELVTQLQRRFDIPLVHAPSAPIVYMAMFDTNALTVARICAIMYGFREEVTSLKQKPVQESYGFTSSSIRKFNNCILDICDALWRCKAFSSGKNEASVFHVPKSVVKQTGIEGVGESFSLYNHIALQGFTHTFLQKSLPPGTPITPRPRSRQSTQDRSAYLDFLTSQGLEGIQGFISSFIKVGKSSTPSSAAPSTASSTATSAYST